MTKTPNNSKSIFKKRLSTNGSAKVRGKDDRKGKVGKSENSDLSKGDSIGNTPTNASFSAKNPVEMGVKTKIFDDLSVPMHPVSKKDKGKKNLFPKGESLLNNIPKSSVSSPDDDKKRFFIDVVAKFCDKCGNGYDTSSVKIVRDSDFSSVIHLSCQKCKSNHIATFVKPMGMTSRSPVNSDLHPDEITGFARKSKVSTDEVLELYNELESTDEFRL